MYALLDTFNNRIVSKHRTVRAAVKANHRFQRAIKRNNGQSSYIPVDCKQIVEGELVELDDWGQQVWTFLDYHS